MSKYQFKYALAITLAMMKHELPLGIAYVTPVLQNILQIVLKIRDAIKIYCVLSKRS